jgi:hypothetical protein
MVPSLAFFITSAVITCSWSAGVDRPGVSKDILISSIIELFGRSAQSGNRRANTTLACHSVLVI